ncbi:hypothetical protein B296_00011858 [Ensete ventricosum]|uniref:Uncharacterized protein n=1 Tax=Ensete ventricosum TaxID=4639 RepID=A0A427A5L4_ENSVE|nr:hypothetical protein B296_00011858 [Ensete ventricosum]
MFFNTDLDDTLYPLGSGIASECLKNIGDYMVERLGIEERKISDLCNLLYKNYGTTMAGLRIFTNADEVHSAKVLKRLGLEDCFQGILCFETLNHLLPSSSDQERKTEVFDIVGHVSHPTDGIELPKTPVLCSSMTVLAISSQGNTLACTQFWYIFVAEIRTSFGEPCKIKSVLMEFMLCCGLQVGTSRRIKGADHALESIHNMKEAFPELWEEGEKSELVLHSGKIGLETSAIA